MQGPITKHLEACSRYQIEKGSNSGADLLNEIIPIVSELESDTLSEVSGMTIWGKMLDDTNQVLKEFVVENSKSGKTADLVSVKEFGEWLEKKLIESKPI